MLHQVRALSRVGTKWRFATLHGKLGSFRGWPESIVNNNLSDEQHEQYVIIGLNKEVSVATKKITKSGLRSFNLKMAALHAVQAFAILLLSKDFTLPVTTSFLNFEVKTQSLIPATKTLFNVPLAYLVVAFLAMSSLAHLIIATVYNKRYNKGLSSGINRARWIEYSLSASTMMVAIALLVGIYDLSLLIGIFGLVAVMNLLGLVGSAQPNNRKNQLAQLRHWLYRRHYSLGDCRSIVLGYEHLRQWRYTNLRILDLRFNLHFLQLLCAQYVFAIQRHWQVERLYVWRARLHYFEPSRQVGTGMASLLWHTTPLGC